MMNLILKIDVENDINELYCPRWRSDACPDCCPGKYGICCWI
ncbi:MAG: hypothetical protein ACXVHW_06240 [Methanobacterium sp.]